MWHEIGVGVKGVKIHAKRACLRFKRLLTIVGLSFKKKKKKTQLRIIVPIIIGSIFLTSNQISLENKKIHTDIKWEKHINMFI